jgi:hypothetical protein
MVILLGVNEGLDLKALIIIGLIAAFGALALAVTRKTKAGGIAPAQCTECGGLISPNAPYCKHCGARQASPEW